MHRLAHCLQRRLAAALAALLLGALTAAAAESAPPRLETNEAYVEAVGRAGDFDIADPKAVFGFVLDSLPDRVKVYPTEAYYYFTFHHRGVRYAGNIRLEHGLRDQGKVHFAYALESTPWGPEEPVRHILLDGSHGVTVERLERLVYRVAYAGKSVTFALNDLSQVVPPAGLLDADERYIGPVFDESAIRFFLVYNARLKLFHYLLDETVPVADVLVRARLTDRILLGKRTGFAFYRDHRRDRKILIGVYETNVRVNNAFDGPFDQLPDDFIEGEALRSAILEQDPSLKGQIDRFGSSPDGQIRYMIAPYAVYTAEGELAPYHRCATARRADAARYYGCFADTGVARR